MLPGLQTTALFRGISVPAEVAEPLTKILLHFDGTDASTSFVDSAQEISGVRYHPWTAVGTGQLDNGIAPKFGTAGLLCGAAAGAARTINSTDFVFGSSDFTLDMWFNRAGGDGARRIMFGIQDSGGSNGTLQLELDAGNHLNAYVFSAATVFTNVISTTTITSAGWHHAAIVRTGNTLKLFLDGVQEGGNVTFSSAVFNSGSPVVVGRAGDYASLGWNGSVDEVRLVIGKAMWTANFTPPTSQYLPVAKKTVYLTTTGAGTWTVPADFTGNNTVEVIGGGASGGGGAASTGAGGGGGGGAAYSRLDNVSLTPSSSVNISIGTGGTSAAGGANGVDGGDTWFSSSATLLAKGGVKGTAGAGSTHGTGGAGGALASGVGATKYAGGNGGAGPNSQTGGGGGGGAAGMWGNGGNGGAYGSGHGGGGNGGGANAAAGSNGGANKNGVGGGAVGTDNVSGGSPGTQGGGGGGGGNLFYGGAGGPGVEWDATHGAGGGGGAGANTNTSSAYGGAGGLYGGGGGGGGNNSNASGAGGQGIIVIQYW